MTLYFLGEPVQTHGDCDSGWVWATWIDKKGKERGAWHWMMQLKTTPWGDA